MAKWQTRLSIGSGQFRICARVYGKELNMNRWLKREVAIAGRSRVLVSVIFFWGPIFLTAILLFVIWLVQYAGN
jgi:hypothetical protein